MTTFKMRIEIRQLFQVEIKLILSHRLYDKLSVMWKKEKRATTACSFSRFETGLPIKFRTKGSILYLDLLCSKKFREHFLKQVLLVVCNLNILINLYNVFLSGLWTRLSHWYSGLSFKIILDVLGNVKQVLFGCDAWPFINIFYFYLL